jgi:hypothetical protein
MELYPITTTGEASYLLGNPYPSALDADTFIINNPLLVRFILDAWYKDWNWYS